MSEYRVPSIDDDEVADRIFRAACLQCGVRPDSWMTSKHIIEMVANRIGTMTRNFIAMSDEEKIKGIEAIDKYLADGGLKF